MSEKTYEVREFEPIGPLTMAPGWCACWREEDGSITKEPLVGFALTKPTMKVCVNRDGRRVVVVRERSMTPVFMGYTADEDLGIEAVEYVSNFAGYAGPDADTDAGGA